MWIKRTLCSKASSRKPKMALCGEIQDDGYQY